MQQKVNWNKLFSLKAWIRWVRILKRILDKATAQKMKFSIKDFFSKCDQIHTKLRIWSNLLKKSWAFCESSLKCLAVTSFHKALHFGNWFSLRLCEYWRSFCQLQFFNSQQNLILVILIDNSAVNNLIVKILSTY